MKEKNATKDGGTVFVIGEPEYVGNFPLRTDITVLGPDVPRGCLAVKDEVEVL